MKAVSRKGKWLEKNSPAHKILSAVGLVLCIVFGFMLICNLTIIIKGTISPEKPPSVLGITPMVVKSGSMSGTAEGHIEVGDLILVGKADPDKLQAGDVIAFMEGSMVVTHRIVEIQTDESGQRKFITKGDANNAPDQTPVTPERLVGIYQSRIPKVGDFALFLQTPIGMLLFIGTPLLAFIIYDILRRQRSTARESRRTAELEAELARLRKQGEDNRESEEE
ncbi:MAG: signal peptidase I [Faecousia sp.]